MTAAVLFISARNRIERLFDALVDPTRRERTMFVVFVGYFATWSLYAIVSQSSQDIYADMGEFVAWSRQVGLGTPKHPPLGAWLLRAWFSVFPREDWAYYCFAILLPTVALWITWRLAARYLPPDKRVAGIALLTFVPFYNFHAIMFNANKVLTPFWALATWWFLRSFETRGLRWAVLAGISAAAAMLAKYWSITLLAGLGVAALSDPRRTAYFSSPAPYVMLSVGTVLLTPNIHWLTTHAFMPFSYAMEAHSGTSALALFSALIFTSNGLAYTAAAIVLCVLATRPSWAAIRDTLWPGDSERRALVIAFAAPFAFAVLTAVLLTVAIESIWMTPAMTLLPIILLSSPIVAMPHLAAVRLLTLAVVFPSFMLAISPLVALGFHLNGVRDYGSDHRAVAQAVERVWRAHTDQPLRIVGSTDFVNGIVFYFKDQPSTVDIDDPKLTPWVNVGRIEREGAAIVCPETNAFCMRALGSYAKHYHIIADEDTSVSRRFFGFASRFELYKIIVIPPDQGTHSAVAPKR
jgi:4-amino-4-deoxy-L-arabinose transferase-like glycosyltransferase